MKWAPALLCALLLPPPSLADGIHRQLKEDIFEFRLLPGDRFSEGEVAERMAVSRTPVRQALYRLQREGHVQVHFRSGWQVSPLDFEQFEELYDLRGDPGETTNLIHSADPDLVGRLRGELDDYLSR